jgi:glycosyltransferase involved in cell wall biosynthesis
MSRLVPYKRVDLILEAFRQMPSRHLVVIGDGPELDKLKGLAGKNVELLGFQPDPIRREYLSRAKGFIFAAEEDFGIAPVEAQAAGTPVIAYGKGGVTETVVEGKTGIFFEEQTVESLVRAIHQFEGVDFDPEEARLNVKRFDISRFQQEFKQFVDQKWEEFCENRHPCRR